MDGSIEINIERLHHLKTLYGISTEMILETLNDARKKKISTDDVDSSNIKLSLLKKIDKEFFNKGLAYYTDPTLPSKDDARSIFFRKEKFNARLTPADRWRVNLIESELRRLNTIQKLSGFNTKRHLPTYTQNDNAREVARKIREKIDIGSKHKTDKDFLKVFIDALSDYDILVYEFVEAHNLRKKTTWEGMMLSPNTIAIKRQQHSFKREIFTLTHELGHYLLEDEEIDEDVISNGNSDSTSVERWCNDFAYYFLVEEHTSTIQEKLQNNLSIENEYIRQISQSFHISRLSIYTHLALNNLLSWEKYSQLRNSLEQQHQDDIKKKKVLREMRKISNIGKQGGAQPVPIHSSLEKNTYQHAYFEGVVDEIDIIDRFKPNIRQIRNGFVERFLYGESL